MDDNLMNRYTDNQCETIIPTNYHVMGYKKAKVTHQKVSIQAITSNIKMGKKMSFFTKNSSQETEHSRI